MTERDWDSLLSGMDAQFEVLRKSILSAGDDCRLQLIEKAHDLSLRMLAVMAAHQRDREAKSGASAEVLGESYESACDYPAARSSSRSPVSLFS